MREGITAHDCERLSILQPRVVEHGSLVLVAGATIAAGRNAAPIVIVNLRARGKDTPRRIRSPESHPPTR